MTGEAHPDRIWWSAAEIAEAGLADMPTTKRRVNDVARRLGWSGNTDFARKRSGKGGGWEYHWKLLPLRARTQLIAATSAAEAPPAKPVIGDRDEAWSWFESLKDGPKAKAETRLLAIQRAEALRDGGLTLNLAVTEAARLSDVAPRSIWNWLEMIEGIAVHDRLPYLAPRHTAKTRKTSARPVDPAFAVLVRDDFLRLSQPSLTSCYDRAVRRAKAEGIEVAPLHTIRRWMKRNVSPITLTYCRKGLDALKALHPTQTRDKHAMHAMEAVNGDYHRFDVFVRFPGAPGQPDEVYRPQMVAFQDVYSGRILSWRIDTSANSHGVQLAIGDMIEDWGIPEHVLLDNGREFAAKAITGGASTRFRFKVKEDDVPGLLVSLGCEIHWATPYSGQSKPIERAFRDLCDRVSRHPAFDGAYTGNNIDAKPENYGARAIPLDDFIAVVAEEIEAHNLRQGRRSEVAAGRSFAEVFDESYAAAPIRKATPEQRRFWLMGAEGITANRKNGEVKLMGNTYWADWMNRLAGEKIIARFDKAALWDGVHVYDLNNAYLGHLPCMARGKFFDVDEARAFAKLRGDWIKRERAAATALRRMNPAEIADDLAGLIPPEDPREQVAAKVVRPIFGQKPSVEDGGVQHPVEARPAEAASVADLAVKRVETEASSREDDAVDRFRRWLDLESRIEAGERLSKEQRKWFDRYASSHEFKGQLKVHNLYGDAMFATPYANEES